MIITFREKLRIYDFSWRKLQLKMWYSSAEQIQETTFYEVIVQLDSTTPRNAIKKSIEENPYITKLIVYVDAGRCFLENVCMILTLVSSTKRITTLFLGLLDCFDWDGGKIPKRYDVVMSFLNYFLKSTSHLQHFTLEKAFFGLDYIANFANAIRHSNLISLHLGLECYLTENSPSSNSHTPDDAECTAIFLNGVKKSKLQKLTMTHGHIDHETLQFIKEIRTLKYLYLGNIKGHCNPEFRRGELLCALKDTHIETVCLGSCGFTNFDFEDLFDEQNHPVKFSHLKSLALNYATDGKAETVEVLCRFFNEGGYIPNFTLSSNNVHRNLHRNLVDTLNTINFESLKLQFNAKTLTDIENAIMGRSVTELEIFGDVLKDKIIERVLVALKYNERYGRLHTIRLYDYQKFSRQGVVKFLEYVEQSKLEKFALRSRSRGDLVLDAAIKAAQHNRSLIECDLFLFKGTKKEVFLRTLLENNKKMQLTLYDLLYTKHTPK